MAFYNFAKYFSPLKKTKNIMLFFCFRYVWEQSCWIYWIVFKKGNRSNKYTGISFRQSCQHYSIYCDYELTNRVLMDNN